MTKSKKYGQILHAIDSMLSMLGTLRHEFVRIEASDREALRGVWKQTEEGSVSQVCAQQRRFYWVRRSGNPLNGHQRTRSLAIMQDAEGNLYLDDFRESALLLDRDEDRMQIEGYGTFKRQNG